MRLPDLLLRRPDAGPNAATSRTGQGRATPQIPRARRVASAYLVTLLVLYLVLLAWIVLWKLEVPWVGDHRVIKLVPFAATRDAGASSSLDVVVNLLLFVPFGVYLGLLAPARAWWASAGLIAAGSLALEVLQYVLAVGRSDVTDVVVNTAGGLAGLVLLSGVRRVFRAHSVRVVTLVCSVVTALVLVATGLFLASGVHLVHVRDAGPSAGAHAPRRP